MALYKNTRIVLGARILSEILDDNEDNYLGTEISRIGDFGADEVAPSWLTLEAHTYYSVGFDGMLVPEVKQSERETLVAAARALGLTIGPIGWHFLPHRS